MVDSRTTALLLSGGVLAPFLRFAYDANQGLEYLLHHYLYDDAFYYFEIARHVPYFNEGVATSGFHPLYLFLNVPLHSQYQPATAVLGSLAILVTAQSVTTLLIFDFGRRLWNEGIGLVAAVSWALSGQVYALSMTGVETVLATALVWIALIFAVRNFDEVTWASVVGLGAFTGLAFYGRMDTTLLLAPSLLVVAHRLFYSNAWRKLLALGLSAGFGPVLWIGYIWTATGSPFPTSGAAIRILAGVDGTFASSTQITEAFVDMVSWIPDFFVVRPGVEAILVGLTPGEGLAMAVLLVFAVLGVVREASAPMGPKTSHRRIVLGCLLTGVLAWASYYAALQGEVRRWYAAELSVFVYGFVVPVAAVGFEYAVRSATARTIVFATCAFILFRFGDYRSWNPQAYDKYKSAKVATRLLSKRGLPSERTRVGALNAGIYDYFTPFEVWNLDGVVNPEAKRAMAGGRIQEYLVEKSVAFVIEHAGAANFDRLNRGCALEIRPTVELSEHYRPYGGSPKRTTYLFRVYRNEECG